MIDGLYLSTFFDIGPLKHHLHVRLRHDHGAALWEVDGGRLTLRRYWEFERLSGQKQHSRALYDAAAARRLFAQLLAEEGAAPEDLVAVWGTPGVETDLAYRAGFDPRYAFHGVAHLMTALFNTGTSPPGEPIVAMSLDAGPDCLFETDAYTRHYYPGYISDDAGVRLFPCESPGRLWSYAREKYGLREGTLMALATASQADAGVDAAQFDTVPFFDFATRVAARTVVDAIHSRAEQAARDGSWLVPPAEDRLTSREHQISAVMKVVAEVSVRVASRNLQTAEREHGANLGASRLALSGGFALNCPTNSQLLADFPFTGFQIPPCTSDSGIALGTGLAGFFPALRAGELTTNLDSAYYGQHPGLTEAELASVDALVESVGRISPDEVAALVAGQGIVAWVNGAAEIGPRALGNRSLLADPRSLKVRDRLNQVKKRQWWRPVAPLVLDDHGPTYFEHYRYSPFMLLNFRATEHARRVAPGILHLDGTARVQSVKQSANPKLHAVLAAFGQLSGVPILGNTSLNDAGEPIVNRLSEAVHFAAGKGIQSLVLGGETLVTLRDARDSYSGPRPRQHTFFSAPAGADREAEIMTNNPHKLSRAELTYFFDNPGTFEGLDLRSAADSEIVRFRTAEYIRDNPGALDRD